ncbi:MAG: PilZ domain-containing protein [Elusimicrobiota bacterium]
MSKTSDRRRHRRVPLTLSIAEPINIELSTDTYEGSIPGLLVNLSAGGMALIVFHELPKDSTIEFRLNFLDVDEDMRGKIKYEKKKFEDTYLVGVEFEKVNKKLKKVLEDMAEDHDICDIRYIIDPENACFPDCSYRPVCGKRIKKEFKK